MAKKSPPSSDQFSNTIKESAQQIWQAGLGAFARAQAEGNKAFESLVKEGMHLQRKTQQVTEERLSEVTARMSSMASDISNRSTGQWDKLESIFEDRVARALQRLGMPSVQQLQALQERIEALEKTVTHLQKQTPQGAATKASSSATTAIPAKKTASKTARKNTAPTATPSAKKAKNG
ncbi:phasin family protein [Curvibacter sp. CHRR-16]|uniref:phasin family protein n=1 Tax=Curvibacter sp. CHRR-16 TaxID=2835872 RepID=UPI001BD9A1F0|nr:phasin family protein [Curvibacter sp. CHRR-16]MBT0569783.1 phasin family protein [Curvibacter sp. CHRR-16]